MEEEDAKARDSAIDLTEFQNTCTNIETRLTKINQIKKGANSDSSQVKYIITICIYYIL
jgi:hypothetical protein